MNEKCLLDLDDLAKVSGGVSEGGSGAEDKIRELKEAVREIDPDYSGHRILSLCDKWEKNGYQPSAREFAAQELGTAHI